MISLRTTLAFALLLFCSSAVVADPLNFMVGPLTFVRPAGWTWKDPDLSTKASAELKLVDSKTTAEAQILCSFSQSPAEAVAARWKSYFIEPAESETTTNNLHGFAVTYVMVQGTHRSKGKIKPDHALVGFIVQTEKGNVYGRLLGPKKLVQDQTIDFKKMVETALTDN